MMTEECNVHFYCASLIFFLFFSFEELLCSYTVKFALEKESGQVIDAQGLEEEDGILTSLASATSSCGKVRKTCFCYEI